MVLIAAHQDPGKARDQTVLAQPDAVTVPMRVVDVDLHVLVSPRADEPVGAIAEAHPRQARIRLERGEDEALHVRVVARVELALGDELGAEAGDRFGLAEELLGMGGGESRGLLHGRVDDRPRAGALLAPRETADGDRGGGGDQHDEADERDGEGRPEADEPAGKRG